MTAGLTQGQLAVLAGVSVGTVRDIEQGRTPAPRPATLARLATALKLTADEREAMAGLGEGDDEDGSAVRPRAASPRRASQPAVRIAVLGPLSAWRDGTRLTLGTPRERAVLGLLVLEHEGLSRAAIIDALWGEDPPKAAVPMVQGHVSRIRKLIGHPGDPQPGGEDLATAVRWDGTGYRLAAEDIHTDLQDFAETAQRARQAAATGDLATACQLYERALGLWRGEPLADVAALRDHPAVTQLAQQRAVAVIEYADAAVAAAIPERVVGHLLSHAGRDPLDERAHARLMVALAATGQQAAAFRLYEELRQRLDAELGVGPGSELAQAYLRILRQETAADEAGPVPPAASARGAAGTRAASVPGDRGGGAVPDAVLPRQLPPGTPHFTGREAEFSELNEMTASVDVTPGTATIMAVSGGAGVGKTALAVHWAHQIADGFPDGQLYVNLRGYGPSQDPVDPAMAISGFLDALQVAPERIPAGLDAQAALYRSLLAGRRMLIMLDNARSADQVRPLLPSNPACLVVVTSRNQLTGLAAAEGARTLTLDTLNHEDARQLLAVRLGAQRVGREAEAVDELIELCARLPLALSVAAARAVRHPGFPLAAITEDLRDEGHRLDALNTEDSSTALRAVFSCSYSLLTPAAARLFRLFSVHPGPDITVPAAASLAGIPLPEARAALSELAGSCLLAEHLPGRFACHDLLRAFAAERARATDGEAERRAALHRTLDHYLLACYSAVGEVHPAALATITLAPAQPGVTAERLAGFQRSLAWCQAEHTVLMAALRRAADQGFAAAAWQLAWLTDHLSYQRAARWHDLVTAYGIALEAARRHDDLAGVAHARCSLARAYAVLGAPDDARHNQHEALRLFRQLRDTAGQAWAHLYAGLATARQGRYAQALEHAQRAAEFFARAGSQAGRAGAFNNIGWYCMLLGDYEQGLAYCQQALATFSDLGDRRGTAIALGSLGHAYLNLGHYADSVVYTQQACEILAEIGSRNDWGMNVAALGDAHYALGDEAAARQEWQQALDVFGSSGSRDADELRAKLSRLGPPGPAS